MSPIITYMNNKFYYSNGGGYRNKSRLTCDTLEEFEKALLALVMTGQLPENVTVEQIMDVLSRNIQQKGKANWSETIGPHVRHTSLLERLTLYPTVLSALLLVGGILLAFFARNTRSAIEIGKWKIHTTDVGIALSFLGVILFVISFRNLLRFLGKKQ
jgi:hypothetical protein